MTGYTTLTNHTYVVAYQAELRDDMRRSRVADAALQPTYGRTAERLSQVWTRITTGTRADDTSIRVRSFDRTTATGACQIADGRAV